MVDLVVDSVDCSANSAARAVVVSRVATAVVAMEEEDMVSRNTCSSSSPRRVEEWVWARPSPLAVLVSSEVFSLPMPSMTTKKTHIATVCDLVAFVMIY